jgi:hypothetical protein
MPAGVYDRSKMKKKVNTEVPNQIGEPVVVPKKDIENVKDKKEEEVKEIKGDVLELPVVFPNALGITKEEILKKQVVDVLQPGQKYFETPEGDIIIGESDKQQIWVRSMNKGQGGWANPKR